MREGILERWMKSLEGRGGSLEMWMKSLEGMSVQVPRESGQGH